MVLEDLLRGVEVLETHGKVASDSVGLPTEDSRDLVAGDIFVAVDRTEKRDGFSGSDGHRFVDAARQAGAAAAIVERRVACELPQFVVADSQRALGILSANAFGNPADSLTIIGITGTNGKTTISYVVESILKAAGYQPGVIGTVNYRFGGNDYPAPFTTPTPLLLHKALGDMVAAGCTHAILEVSSAALSMGRLAGLTFDIAAFTNLTQDHLDVHGSMEAYRNAKARLFRDHLAVEGTAVIAADDDSSQYFAEAAAPRSTIEVSTCAGRQVDIAPSHAASTVDGIVAQLTTKTGSIDVKSNLIGDYNISNIAVATGIAAAAGIANQTIERGIRELPGVPGRVERVANELNLNIFVDYAHTPDALANVLDALKPLTKARLLCVFGCGGDRDPDKRPKMGAAVHQRADLAFVTSDNPRTEDPQAIIDMILPATPDAFFVDTDRAIAIRAAIAEATPDDIVVIAGKGHEDYQIVGSEKTQFDDRAHAASAVDERWRTSGVEIHKAIGGEFTHSQAEPIQFARVTIDSRTVATGDLYVAIVGDNLDGHDFCDDAVARGAAGIVVAKRLALDVPQFIVDDPRLALGRLGRAASRWWSTGTDHRRMIAVTGSSGKTTTKDLIAAALRSAGQVHKSAGSHNNETGVPLTLFGLRKYHDYAVIEMGQRKVGDIAYLMEIVEPHIGVVVNAGDAHVGVVGSRDDIARGKAQVFDGLPSFGYAIYPADDDRLRGYAQQAASRLSFGDTNYADVSLTDYRADEAGTHMHVQAGGHALQAQLALVGRHNALNACCALAVAKACNIGLDDAAAALHKARPAAMRMELRTLAKRHFLVDCYNANPDSMRAAINTLAELRGDRRGLAVLADMLELGDDGPQAHRDIGSYAHSRDIDVIALGAFSADLVAKAETSTAVTSIESAVEELMQRSQPGDWILVKASRGCRLERVLDGVENHHYHGGSA